MGTKIKNPSRLVGPFLCLFLGACSMYNGGPPGESHRVTLAPPDKFEEADTNKDNLIDKEEAKVFAEKEKEKKTYSFWVFGAILCLSFLACLCTPAPAAYIKTKLINGKDYIKKQFLKLSAYIKKKKKGS